MINGLDKQGMLDAITVAVDSLDWDPEEMDTRSKTAFNLIRRCVEKLKADSIKEDDAMRELAARLKEATEYWKEGKRHGRRCAWEMGLAVELESAKNTLDRVAG